MASRKSPSGKKTGGKTSRKKAASKKGIEKKDTCFVISPFGGWHDRYYEDIYAPAVEAAGLDPKRADDLYRPSAIVHDIWDYVKSCRVMLADLTDKNPNVFYELGLGHAAGKPVVLLAQTIDDVPFDLRSLRVIEYEVLDPRWSETLREKIEAALEEVLKSPELAVLPSFLHQDVRKQPTVPPEDRRLLSLESEVRRLRAEVLSSRHRDRISAGDARELIRKFVHEGMPHGVIVRRVSAEGAPRSWVENTLSEFIGQEGLGP